MIDSKRKLLTLCIIHEPPRVLLGMKKRGFGVGRWNGFGGKVKEGETLLEAARRELFEEAGVICKDLEKQGILTFEFLGDPVQLEVHVFRGVGVDVSHLCETPEMSPKWFQESNLPFASMWPDDRYWFPFFLARKTFKGRFLFENQDRLLSFELEEAQSL